MWLEIKRKDRDTEKQKRKESEEKKEETLVSQPVILTSGRVCKT